MLKHFLLFSLAALLCGTASAQFRYTFKDTTSPYVPLTSGTSINGSDIWDDDTYTTPMAFTWTLDSSVAMTDFNLMLGFPGFIADMNNFSDASGFILTGADLADRGTLSKTASLSPIRYVVAGNAPNRIFKVELSNTGFFNEYSVDSTMNDFANVQMWFYETSNIMELHFGPSAIVDPSTDFNGGLLFSFISHADFFSGTQGTFYYLSDNGGTLAIDSTAIGSPTGPTNLPGSWPADGTVYRFTPRKFCTTFPTASFTAAMPTGMIGQYVYTGTTTNVDSLVWNFGDGQKMSVLSNYSNLITHTYMAAGKYNVSVIAYGKCGNDTSSVKQSTVAVQNIAALGNVQVYPNPLHDRLIIEGMKPGGKATVLSIVGQAIMSADINADKQTMDLSALSAGIYQLMLTDANGNMAQQRIVKQ